MNFELPDTCMVHMDERLYDSADFITVLAKEDGKVSLYYNTDALTLGMALQMIAHVYTKEIAKVSAEDRREIEEVLGPAFEKSAYKKHAVGELLWRLLNG